MAAIVTAIAAAAIAVTALLVPPTVRAAAVNARPPDILSWRHQSLDQAEYEKLAGQWEAYVRAHPKDARAMVEWGNALRYSGKYEEATAKYRQAFSVDSLDAAATEAYASSLVLLHGEGDEWKSAHRMLQRALARDPSYARTLYLLCITSLRAGDQALADRCLRGMVESGDMPRPLVDYGANIVEGAPPNAIILTNGDNDTYPPLAYQRLTGRRRDVTIANLSLLNTSWYIRYLRGIGVPITMTDEEIKALMPGSPERLPADQLVVHLGANLGKDGSRPLLYAVTVPPFRRGLATGNCLGLLVPVTGGPVTEPDSGEERADSEPPCDWARTKDLLDAVYRLDGVTDRLVDWQRESSVAKLVRNYAALECGVADWLMANGHPEESGRYYLQAVRQFVFHHQREHAQEVIDDWAKADPKSRLLPEARKLLSD